jgi:mRNA interferase HigB
VPHRSVARVFRPSSGHYGIALGGSLDPAVGQYAGPHVWLVLNRRRLCISPISHYWNVPWRASILKAGRVVFNIKANDYRLIAVVRYENGVMMLRFFGSHEEYDQVDAETV